MVDQVENILRIFPRIIAHTTFGFGLNQLNLRPRLMRTCNAILASPLVGNALDILASTIIEQNIIDETVVIIQLHAVAAGPRHIFRTIERAQPNIGVKTSLLKSRSKIIADEHFERFGIPQRTRELLIGEHLILHMQLVHGNAMLGISLNVLDEILRIRLQILRSLHQTAIVVSLRTLHPRRRAPRAGEQLHVRLPFLRAMNIRNQRLLIMLDGEMLHLVIAVGLVIAIPMIGEIIGADRRTIEGEVHLIRAEQFLDDLIAFFLDDRLQRKPAKLVEAAAEAAQRLIFVAVKLQIGSGSGMRGFDF